MKTKLKLLSNSFEVGIRRYDGFDLRPLADSLSVDIGSAKLEVSMKKSDFAFKISGIFTTQMREDDICEIIVYRKKISELMEFLKTRELSMLVNPSNTGGDACGLEFIKDNPQNPEVTSSWHTIVGNPNQNAYLLFAFLHPVAHRTFLRFRNGYFECGCIVQRNFAECDSFESDVLFVKKSDSPHDLLDDFASVTTKDVKVRKLKSDYTGWNSWDYYFKMFEEEDLRENIIAIRKFNDKNDEKIKMIMIDDGWFTDYGDWRANGRFPYGLKRAADLIKEGGFDAGIWLAPFHLSYFSKAFQRMPGLLTSFRNNEKALEEWAFGPLGFLDPTSPDGESFLRRLFEKLKHLGFSCFKVDFIHNLATFGKDKQFFDDKLGRIEIIRRGLSIIREAIGDDSYLLTCGCPPEAAIGIADINRIGGDISTYDSTVKLNARFLAVRYWMNNSLWTSDPDFLIVRSDATANDKHHNPLHFNPEKGTRSGAPWTTENSSRLWAALAVMSGGFIALADHLGKLNNKGEKIIKTALNNAVSQAAVPLDLMEHILPEIWLRGGDSAALAVINWSDIPRKFFIDMKKHPEIRSFIDCEDIWNGLKFSIKNNIAVVEIPSMDLAWFIK